MLLPVAKNIVAGPSLGEGRIEGLASAVHQDKRDGSTGGSRHAGRDQVMLFTIPE